MILLLSFLLAGCKQKTGMEILMSKMDDLKALKSQYVVHIEGEKDVVINVLYSKPNRILFTSDDFVVALNEKNGHFESVFSEKTYDHLPWDGRIYPGTGLLVSIDLFDAGPSVASPPQLIAPAAAWTLENKKGNIERYTKTIQSSKGPQTFKLEITDAGVPSLYINPDGTTFKTNSFEIVDEIPESKFLIEPTPGFVNHRTATDTLMLDTGANFSWSAFKAAPDVSNFKLQGPTMFIFVDPKEQSSIAAMKWINTPGSGFRKVTVTSGNATSGFFDPSGQEIGKVTTSTPLFVLVDAQSKITGLWLGFDSERTSDFNKDIQSALAGDH